MQTILRVEALSKRYVIERRRQRKWSVPWSFLKMRRTGHLANARKVGNEIWALREVSFDVPRGTILGVIGTNGAGKTTLLKVLSRVTPPTAGRVTGFGRVVPLLEMGACFHPDLSGRENILLSAALHGIPQRDAMKRLPAIVDFAEVAEFIDAPIRHFSSGMYLRLAFATAVNMQPDILLADEVLAVGDLAFQQKCLHHITAASGQGLTVLFVSHDMAAIQRLCHRVLWLHAGKVVAIGEPSDVVEQYEQAASTQLPPQGHDTVASSAYGCIERVRLRGIDGEEIGVARVNETVRLELSFSILKAPATVRCGVDVYTRGVHVFRSMQPVDFPVEVPGHYRAEALIPPNLLSETRYTVNASVNVRHDHESVDLLKYEAVSFNVYDTDPGSSARGNYAGRLRGVVTPKLAWNCGREDLQPRSFLGARG